MVTEEALFITCTILDYPKTNTAEKESEGKQRGTIKNKWT